MWLDGKVTVLRGLCPAKCLRITFAGTASLQEHIVLPPLGGVGLASIYVLVDVSDIFCFFSCSGRGKGEFEAPGREGVRFLIENPRRGVSRRERVQGAGRVSAANLGFLGGGGAKYFFSGAEMSTKK